MRNVCCYSVHSYTLKHTFRIVLFLYQFSIENTLFAWWRCILVSRTTFVVVFLVFPSKSFWNRFNFDFFFQFIFQIHKISGFCLPNEYSCIYSRNFWDLFHVFFLCLSARKISCCYLLFFHLSFSFDKSILSFYPFSTKQQHQMWKNSSTNDKTMCSSAFFLSILVYLFVVHKLLFAIRWDRYSIYIKKSCITVEMVQRRYTEVIVTRSYAHIYTHTHINTLLSRFWDEFNLLFF